MTKMIEKNNVNSNLPELSQPLAFPTTFGGKEETSSARGDNLSKLLSSFPISEDNGNNMINLIKYPVITEKSYLALFKNQQYTFDVDIKFSKPQIKKLFENLFNVNVIAINTHIPPRKNIRVGTTKGYRARYKRAILTLKKGQSLKFSIS